MVEETKILASQGWSHILLILPLLKHRQVSLCEFKGNLSYIASFSLPRATWWENVSKNKDKKILVAN